MERAAIIGAGTIGSYLEERLRSGGTKTMCISPGRLGISGKDRTSKVGMRQMIREVLSCEPQVVFLAIPTLDKGETAASYMTAFAERGIPVVTSEKGAIAGQMKEIAPYIDSVGCSASCGGGVQMLPWLQSRQLNRHRVQLRVVPNASLNFIFNLVANGATLEDACASAEHHHYLEPTKDGEDSLARINGEVHDAVLKICVIYNIALAEHGRYITPDNLTGELLTKDQLSELYLSAVSHRFFVEFSNRQDRALPRPQWAEFHGGMGDWQISGGFREISGGVSWIPPGPGNAAMLLEDDMKMSYVIQGQGAGPEPTTTAMLNDAYNLLAS